jgi:hypothetical protein
VGNEVEVGVQSGAVVLGGRDQNSRTPRIKELMGIVGLRVDRSFREAQSHAGDSSRQRQPQAGDHVGYNVRIRARMHLYESCLSPVNT